jgi:hypothetical protein
MKLERIEKVLLPKNAWFRLIKIIRMAVNKN